jgi:hypothetical protein
MQKFLMLFIIGGEDKKKDAALIMGGFRTKNYNFLKQSFNNFSCQHNRVRVS